MKTLVVVAAMLFAGTAYSDECYQKTITICKSKGKVKKKVTIVPGPIPSYIYIDRIVWKRSPVLSCPGCPPTPVAVVGGHFAAGFGATSPYSSAMIGLRLRFPAAWVGFEVFSALQYGVGFQTLFYPYQGPVVRLHIIDPGVLVTGDPFSLLGAADVPRRVDLLLGAGVEVKLTCKLDLTVDWRVGIPDPSKLGSCQSCVAGRKLDPGAVVGNAFAASQVFVGLLLHN